VNLPLPMSLEKGKKIIVKNLFKLFPIFLSPSLWPNFPRTIMEISKKRLWLFLERSGYFFFQTPLRNCQHSHFGCGPSMRRISFVVDFEGEIEINCGADNRTYHRRRLYLGLYLLKVKDLIDAKTSIAGVPKKLA